MIKTLSALLAFALALPLFGQTAPADEAREKRIAWWRDARFGMFIHWGLYAIPAGEWKGQPIPGLGEWIMNRAKIPVAEYEQLAKQFNPVKFDADAIVAVAKNAGMKYITITSKHHDGFAMFGSKVSPYNIVDATPFHRDPLKELAAACQRAGLRLCFYYSQTQDWHESGGIGNTWDFKEPSPEAFQNYYDNKVLPQVRELLTNYGPIGLIWFDTPRNITAKQSQQLADLVHQLQPNCLVSGRVGHGLGDYDSAGDNQISVGKVKRDWETPVTLNDTWGFKKDDNNWKSAAVLIRQLAQVSSRGGNYLLNVGPTAEGVIPQPSVDRLAQVGRWMKVNGDSIYGTSASPFPYELPWGVITVKPGKLYLHVFHWPGKEFVLYGVESKVRQAYLLADASHKPLSMKQEHHADTGLDELRLTIPAEAPDPDDAVIVLETSGAIEVTKMLMQQPDRQVTLPAYLADIHHAPGSSQLRFDSRGVVERWLNKYESLSWDYQVSSPGTFDVVAITSGQKYGKDWEGGHSVRIKTAGKDLAGTIADDGKVDNPSNPYWPYVKSKLGQMEIAKAGKYNLTLQPQSIVAEKKFGLTLVSIQLVPR
ncbi:MAG TPA: alpha-L-fucosidase [Bryobacteraceae bacterium]|nr:alpha-L-fucosidase [Bryobacteraceae bacterium]